MVADGAISHTARQEPDALAPTAAQPEGSADEQPDRQTTTGRREEADEESETIDDWLKRLEALRPLEANALTPELLEAVGPLPTIHIPPATRDAQGNPDWSSVFQQAMKRRKLPAHIEAHASLRATAAGAASYNARQRGDQATEIEQAALASFWKSTATWANSL